ncbi:hypothetical protein CEXT_425801 [Caerostris extrusa]|uniref:Uncharacterized protein n=1 Tax=Caerostris extrusa TaxID=172846 RepID=A0AAV4N100_CAEEX|nr:hypothetical protein CEXT_425801 [Caerostris extrusa]
MQLLDLINTPVLFHLSGNLYLSRRSKKKIIPPLLFLQPIKPPLTHLVEQHFGVAPKQNQTQRCLKQGKYASALRNWVCVLSIEFVIELQEKGNITN